MGVVLVGLSAQVGWVEERNPTIEVDEAARERAILISSFKGWPLVYA